MGLSTDFISLSSPMVSIVVDTPRAGASASSATECVVPAYALEHTEIAQPQVKSMPERFELHCIIDQETHDLIERARSLSHRRQEIPEILKHALQHSVPQLE